MLKKKIKILSCDICQEEIDRPEKVTGGEIANIFYLRLNDKDVCKECCRVLHLAEEYGIVKYTVNNVSNQDWCYIKKGLDYEKC